MLEALASVPPQHHKWNEGATFVGVHAGIKYYTRGGKIICLLGGAPQKFNTVHAFKLAVSRRENELE